MIPECPALAAIYPPGVFLEDDDSLLSRSILAGVSCVPTPQKWYPFPSKRGLEVSAKLNSLLRVQRLFATFPDGQPGAALLLLRLSLAGVLALHGAAYWQGLPAFWWRSSAVALDYSWRSVCIRRLWRFSGQPPVHWRLFFFKGDDPVGAVFVLLVMVALGMLGAGAYSLDARMYGRREVVVPARHDQ